MSSCILVAMFQGDPLLYLGKKVQLVCFCKLQCNSLVTEKRCCACRKWYFLHAQSSREKFCHLYYLPTTTVLQQQQTVLILCGRILANLVDLQNTLLRRIHLKLIRITGTSNKHFTFAVETFLKLSKHNHITNFSHINMSAIFPGWIFYFKMIQWFRAFQLPG